MFLTGHLRVAAALVVVLGLFGCRTEKPAESSKDAATATAVDPDPPLPPREVRGPLRLGRPPHIEHVQTEYEPLAEYLGKALGQPVNLVVPRSYDGVVDLLARGYLDMALLTPFTYVKAKEQIPSLRLLVTLLGEGAQKYRGYVVARAGGPISKPEDLKGHTFGFVDRASTSGYLFPLAWLAKHDIDPEKDFARVEFFGSHQKVIHEVLGGDVDAGAVSSTTFRHMRDESVANQLSIVGKTDWIPFDAFVVHPSVSDDLALQIKKALLALSTRTPEGREILTGVTTTSGFVEVDDAHYDGVRAVAEALGMMQKPVDATGKQP